MKRRYGENAQMVRYADDMVILTNNENASYIWYVLGYLLGELGLEVNEEKSRITKSAEGFDFLSFHFIRRYRAKLGKIVTLFFPSKDAVKRFKGKVGALTARSIVHLKDEEKLVLELNRFIVGWSNYFNHSNAAETYNRLQRFVEWKFAKFICFRHHYTRLSYALGGFLDCYKYGLAKLNGRIFHGVNPPCVVW